MNKRLYKQNCALAHASDLLGERWTFLVLRELFIQPCRFRELNIYLQGMGTNLLTSRLKELEHQGIIERCDPGNKRSAYQLTKAGLELEPTVLNMIKWGLQHTRNQKGFNHFDHWDLLAMKALFSPLRTSESITVQFDCETLTGWCNVMPLSCEISMGKHASPDIVLNEPVSWLQIAKPSQLTGKLEKFIKCFR